VESGKVSGKCVRVIRTAGKSAESWSACRVQTIVQWPRATCSTARSSLQLLLRANYRASRKGRSRAEFESKLGIVLEEGDECVGWLEFLRDMRLTRNAALLQESKELARIFAKAVKTARANSTFHFFRFTRFTTSASSSPTPSPVRTRAQARARSTRQAARRSTEARSAGRTA